MSQCYADTCPKTHSVASFQDSHSCMLCAVQNLHNEKTPAYKENKSDFGPQPRDAVLRSVLPLFLQSTTQNILFNFVQVLANCGAFALCLSSPTNLEKSPKFIAWNHWLAWRAVRQDRMAAHCLGVRSVVSSCPFCTQAHKKKERLNMYCRY